MPLDGNHRAGGLRLRRGRSSPRRIRAGQCPPPRRSARPVARHRTARRAAAPAPGAWSRRRKRSPGWCDRSGRSDRAPQNAAALREHRDRLDPGRHREHGRDRLNTAARRRAALVLGLPCPAAGSGRAGGSPTASTAPRDERGTAGAVTSATGGRAHGGPSDDRHDPKTRTPGPSTSAGSPSLPCSSNQSANRRAVDEWISMVLADLFSHFRVLPKSRINRSHAHA